MFLFVQIGNEKLLYKVISVGIVERLGGLPTPLWGTMPGQLRSASGLWFRVATDSGF